MTKILITGKNSFIGKNYRKFSGYHDVQEVSLIDKKPEEIDFSGYDIILHLSAIVHQSKKIHEEQYFIVNRDLPLRVAKKARENGVRQFIFLSTLKVYGDIIPDGTLRNEESPCYPDDAYGKSKYAAEVELRELENNNFKIAIIRTPVVYGEGVKANMLNIIRLIKFCPVLPFGNIQNRRNFTYVENLVGFIDRIIEKGKSGVFITMDEKAISTTYLVNQIADNLKKRILLFKLPEFIVRIGYKLNPGIFLSLFSSLEVQNEKTKKELDYIPPFSIEEGLKRTVSSYLRLKN